MRRGHLHKYIGMERAKGLSEFISGDIPIGQALHQTTIKGLVFIPTGERPPNPAELLLHKRFMNCLSVLTPRFDHIIIDSPPVMSAAETADLAAQADGVILVVRHGTPLRDLDDARQRLAMSGTPILGYVYNRAQGKSHGYGYGYGYGKDPN